ncbi:hypothetical protein HU200_005901 [Digitaria exilis]|uniref:Disease resistance R13L4/SHOC-2-like LRR domain-containing protein n=1 Tax=Digitaria exilis TaxID=1010633 RepID=A0A835KTU7_9POAL|nr:hypothetical protein HU200_005901 [Digitaria exilis]
MSPAAASEEGDEQEQDEASSLHETRWKKGIEEALRLLRSCHARCSQMLEAARPGRLMGNLQLRCLEFLDKELSYMVAVCTEQSLQHINDMMVRVPNMTNTMSINILRAIDEADPQLQNTLLQRATRRFRRRHEYPYRLMTAVTELHYLSTAITSRLGMPHEAADCFGLPPTLNPDEDEAWQWNVNHLQHQSLASKSAEMGFAFTSTTLNLLETASATAGKGNETTGRIARRLALHHDDPNIPSLLEKVDLSQTRSLAVSGAVTIGVPLDNFVNLVVLDAEGWENFGDDDLLRICSCKMFFLMYLSIRNTRVSKLPPEIKELLRLQVLDASYTQITELHLGVFGTTQLRRLDLRGTTIVQLTMPIRTAKLGRLDLGGTQLKIPITETSQVKDSLRTLLLGAGGVTSSTVTPTKLPHDIGHFKRLGTLATVDLSEQPASFINALGDLEDLRVLAITWSFHQSCDRDYCEALLSSIGKWRGSMEFLASVSRPPEALEKFKVTVGRFTGVPQWFHMSRYTPLSFVQITVCKLEAHDLEILGNLSQLKCLVLSLDFIPREAIVINYNVGFPGLDRFSIDCQVPWLTFESHAMPRLTCLQLKFNACPTSLISAPMGITNLCSLTKVALWYNVRYANSSSVKRTVEAVREDVAKCRMATKVLSLFINGIKQDDVKGVHEETESATRAPSGTGTGAEDDVQEVDEITEV